MKPKEFIDMFPFGYVRLRNQNGSVALTLNTKSAEAYIFAKRILKSSWMPPINQREADHLQQEFGTECTIIDWFSDDSCRYFITTSLDDSLLHYRLVLNACFGNDVFEVTGNFYEKKNENHRKRVCYERYLKKLPPDALTTEADFTNECYDVIFPDDALSHCRRLGNVIAMNTYCPAKPSAHELENGKTLEDENEADVD